MNHKQIIVSLWINNYLTLSFITLQRWRRRFFTLKQGEIPQQFCLEYYTDRCCRKLKGTIDLDQCEEVECGLRMEDRKSKFQYIFAVKTQKRIYYLAAEQETQMRDWVKCICQVCNLHDTKQLQPVTFPIDNQRQCKYLLCDSVNIIGNIRLWSIRRNVCRRVPHLVNVSEADDVFITESFCKVMDQGCECISGTPLGTMG